MNRIIAAAVGAAALIAPLSASALVIDFTDDAVWTAPTTNPVTKKIGGVNVTVSGVPSLNNNETLPTPAPKFAFAGGFLEAKRDGFGVVSDEINGHTNSTPQSISVAFDTEVFVTNLAFLDLFKNGDEFEQATVTFWNGLTSFAPKTFNSPGGAAFGYHAFASGFSGAITKLVFTAANIVPADDGTNDYAPAAIEFSVVPLPAPILMLLGALGGFAFLRRRQTA